MNLPKKRKKILITGCGRSGTSYISALLIRYGFDVKHEAEGRDGVASWCMAVSNDKAVFGPALNEFKFDLICHQVRNPLKVISSVHTISELSWGYIKEYIPIKKEDSLLIKSAKYWYYWNIKAEEISGFTYRIEDIDLIFPKILGFLGAKNYSLDGLKNIPRDINKRMHKEIKLEDIEKENSCLFKNILDLSNKYGYKKDELLGNERGC